MHLCPVGAMNDKKTRVFYPLLSLGKSQNKVLKNARKEVNEDEVRVKVSIEVKQSCPISFSCSQVDSWV